MPDDRRNKANSYRGCAFFAYKGVKLDKMFKEALKEKEHEDLAQDKEEEEKEIYAYGIFEFDKKTKKKRFLSGWLKEDEEFKPEDLRTVVEESKKSKRNCKY